MSAVRVAVAGAGPAGCYAAYKVATRIPRAHVDLLESLPSPYGLVRYGVAPDNSETKAVESSLHSHLSRPNIRLLANITIGSDISVNELRSLYHAVILATGSQSEKPLNIPNESPPRTHSVISSKQLVGWYNGHPHDVHSLQSREIATKLSHARSVAIIGLGNVSIDCARMLLRSPSELQFTDICSHALDALTHSSVKRVILIGRRGPAQASYTAREVREAVQLNGVQAMSPHDELHDSITDADAHELSRDRARRRAHEALTKHAVDCDLSKSQSDAFSFNHNPSNAKELHFRFLRSPVSFELPDPDTHPDHHHLGLLHGVRLERNELKGDAFSRKAVPTGDTSEVVPCELAIRSIGYKSQPVDDGVPFDHTQGRVQHTGGRVDGSKPSIGLCPLYACGWLKRGPTGVISTNVMDAEDTASTVADDLVGDGDERDASCDDGDHAAGGARSIDDLLDQRGVRPVTLDGWHRIDSAEQDAGRARGAPREKVVTVEQMLKIARSQ